MPLYKNPEHSNLQNEATQYLTLQRIKDLTPALGADWAINERTVKVARSHPVDALIQARGSKDLGDTWTTVRLALQVYVANEKVEEMERDLALIRSTMPDLPVAIATTYPLPESATAQLATHGVVHVPLSPDFPRDSTAAH